jgi:hypothetical protein
MISFFWLAAHLNTRMFSRSFFVMKISSLMIDGLLVALHVQTAVGVHLRDEVTHQLHRPVVRHLQDLIYLGLGLAGVLHDVFLVDQDVVEVLLQAGRLPLGRRCRGSRRFLRHPNGCESTCGCPWTCPQSSVNSSPELNLFLKFSSVLICPCYAERSLDSQSLSFCSHDGGNLTFSMIVRTPCLA